MKTIHLGRQKLSIESFATQSNAVLGLRSSGKTYTATWIAERFMEANIPFVTFDPIGVWRFLRVPGQGKGFKVVIAGENGDLPLTAETAPEIVRAAMREDISLVIDLYSMHLSKGDWKKIVEHSVRVLFYENGAHGMRHIFIEEAAEFVPQILQYPEQRMVYAEIEKLSRMGRNVGLGLTLINQRAEQINKAVLENCNRMFLHRQRGKNSLKSIYEWIEVAHDISPDRAKAIGKTVPGLKAGQCLLMDENTEEPEQIAIPTKESLHPKESWTAKERAAAMEKAISVTPLVDRMNVALGEAKARVDATDPKQLQKRIRELEAQLARPEKPAAVKEVPALTKEDRTDLERFAAEVRTQTDRLEAILKESIQEVAKSATMALGVRSLIEERLKVSPAPMASSKRLDVTKTTPKLLPKTVQERSADSNAEMPGGQRRILMALAQRLTGLTKEQIGVRAGLSSGTGSFGQHMARLKESGYLSAEGGRFFITQEGMDALGHYEPLPTGRGLYEYWLTNQLEDGAARILTALWTAHPQTMTKAELGEATGLSHSTGSFGQHLAKLRRLELITGRGDALSASEELFE